MKRIKFKYHPNINTDEILKHGKGICNCCGKEVTKYIENVYAEDDLDCICLECIHNGKAAEKFDASFVQDAEHVSDPQKTDELFQRTPGYMSWQGEFWLSCCDDYCEYLGPVGIKELDELGIKDQVLNDYIEHWPDGYSIEDINEYLTKNGSVTGYLFRCLHCGKYRLHIDSD